MKKLLLAFLLIVLSAAQVCTAEGRYDIQTRETDAGFQVYGSYSGARVHVMVLKPSYSFEDSASLQEKIYYVDEVYPQNGEYIVEVPWSAAAPYGSYTVRLGFDDITGDEKERTISYYRANSTERDDCVEAFRNAEQKDIAELVELYSTDIPLLSLSPAEKTKVLTETFFESFRIAWDGFDTGKFNATENKIQTPMDIERVIRGAILIDALNYGDSAQTEINAYMESMPLIFDEDYEKNDFLTSYKKAAAALSLSSYTLDDFMLITDRAKALALILDGSYEQRAHAISYYASALGIKETTLGDTTVSMTEIAKRIGNQSIDAYLNGMDSIIADIIKELEDEREKPFSPSRGGGGGGGSAVTSTPVVLPELEPVQDETLSAVPEQKNVFDDLEGYDWARSAIEQLAARNIVNGVGNGKFEPARLVSREETVKMIVAMLQLDDIPGEVPFVDCQLGDWYYPYVRIAYYYNLVRGIDDNHFGVGMSITRQDFSVILESVLRERGVQISIADDVAFSDASDIAEYAKTSVMGLASFGVINGYEDGSFQPERAVSRAEIAVLISRTYDIFGLESEDL